MSQSLWFGARRRASTKSAFINFISHFIHRGSINGRNSKAKLSFQFIPIECTCFCTEFKYEGLFRLQLMIICYICKNEYSREFCCILSTVCSPTQFLPTIFGTKPCRSDDKCHGFRYLHHLLIVLRPENIPGIWNVFKVMEGEVNPRMRCQGVLRVFQCLGNQNAPYRHQEEGHLLHQS